MAIDETPLFRSAFRVLSIDTSDGGNGCGGGDYRMMMGICGVNGVGIWSKSSNSKPPGLTAMRALSAPCPATASNRCYASCFR